MSKKKQLDLPGIKGPGVAPKRIPEIDKKADQYIRERDKRCEMTPREIAAKGKLIDAIHKHKDEIGADKNGEIVYRYDDVVITLKPGKELLKVRSLGDESEE